MDLQSAFYIVAIVAMGLFIVFIISALAVILYLRKQIWLLQKSVVSRIIDYTRPVDIFKGFTSSIIGNLFLKIRDNFGLR